MKAISLWEPYASLMRINAKTWETRGWKTDYRGDLAIHAAKKFIPLSKDVSDPIVRALSSVLDNQKANYGLPAGAVVCVVELYDCLPVDEVIAKFPDCYGAEKHFGDFSPGRSIWMTRNLRPLREPVPIIGHQGFWTLSPEQAEKVNAQIL